jgi:hypothetical protein
LPGLTFTLAEYPFDWIELACDGCERRGRLPKARLIREHGAELPMAEYMLRPWPLTVYDAITAELVKRTALDIVAELSGRAAYHSLHQTLPTR